MKLPHSTVRLAAVVEACGEPEPVTLWVNPLRDKRFQAAIKENRVLTVSQETVGSRKDYGIVGFHKEKNVSYWLFPKPLDAFANKRVIGINYDLLKQPPLRSPSASELKAKQKTRQAAPAPKPKPPPPLKAFRVTVRCQASLDVPLEVRAPNQAAARQHALDLAAAQAQDFSKATPRRTVVRVESIQARLDGGET